MGSLRGRLLTHLPLKLTATTFVLHGGLSVPFKISSDKASSKEKFDSDFLLGV